MVVYDGAPALVTALFTVDVDREGTRRAMGARGSRQVMRLEHNAERGRRRENTHINIHQPHQL